MASFSHSQLIDLFTKLATHLHFRSSSSLYLTHDDDDDGSANFHLPISSLAQSLNHTATLSSSSSSTGIFDAALSLLCFRASHLFDSSIQCLSDTIIAVFSSWVSCRALVFPEEEALRRRIYLSCCDYADLIGVSAHVIAILGGSKSHEMQQQKLLRAVLKLAASVSCCNSFSPSTPLLPNENSRGKWKEAVQKLTFLLPEDTSPSIRETPLRLLVWSLDPSTLKHDLSSILQEKMGRPFLCMAKELHERAGWKSIILCLVTSPTMFVEARALLHHWFIRTGLASLWELQTELVSSLLDALARPIRWGVLMDMGLKLPFLHAYFPEDHLNLSIKLSGPILCEGFLDLVHVVVGQKVPSKQHMDSQASRPPYGHCQQAASLTDHKSTWAMLMDFPAWFYFAAMLLFPGEQLRYILQPAFTKTSSDIDETYSSELRFAAANFLSWILNPINETKRDHLFHCLTEISESWTLKLKGVSTHRTLSCGNASHSNIVRIKKNSKELKNNDSETNEPRLELESWLKNFDRCYIKYNEGRSTNLTSVSSDSLFRKISLGILIGYSRYLDDKACELLVHYAATGAVLQTGERNNFRKNPPNQRSKGFDFVEVNGGMDERQGAAAGACLVFYLFDIIEDMLVPTLESEDSLSDLVCNMKGKVGGYLFRCIKMLVVFYQNNSKENRVMLTDLRRRLERWRRQGVDVFEGSNAIIDLSCDLNTEISS